MAVTPSFRPADLGTLHCCALQEVPSCVFTHNFVFVHIFVFKFSTFHCCARHLAVPSTKSVVQVLTARSVHLIL